MAKGQRDYKAEYARRTAKAKAKGFSGYGQYRRVRAKNKTFAEKVAQRMDETGLLDSGFFESDDLFDTSMFWDLFRGYYGKVNTA